MFPVSHVSHRALRGGLAAVEIPTWFARQAYRRVRGTNKSTVQDRIPFCLVFIPFL